MVKKVDNISASHILIMHKESKDSRADISKNEARKLVDDIHKKLVDNKVQFKDMAIKHSDCSSSTYGGNLGKFGKGVMVKGFEDAAFKLKVNEISAPIETEFGFHIIKRDSWSNLVIKKQVNQCHLGCEGRKINISFLKI